jgi:signal peptidase I
MEPTGTGSRPLRLRRSLLRRAVIELGRGAAVVALLHFFVLQVSIVRGQSMRPSLEDGDRLVVDRLCYRLADVQRFDLVVLEAPHQPGIDFVKRVIGLPGDRVRIEAGQVFVNGERIADEFAAVPDCAQMAELRVMGGHYFVLGDNRPVSFDSREFGLVPAENLRGKVRARFWPLVRAALF